MSTTGKLVVDGPNIAHAANSTTPLKVGNLETTAVFGFLRSLRATAGMFSMLKPVVLWDGRSWRHSIFPEYKAGRKKPPETKLEEELAERRAALPNQLKILRKALELLAVPQFLALNLEADDLAATIVRKRKPGERIVLITSDRDWLQLIDENITVLDPIRKTRTSANDFTAKIGYKKTDGTWVGVPSPSAYVDVKCLMGDMTDDIPGVGGIGEKGAIDLVLKFGSVTEFFNKVNFEQLKLPKKLADFASSEEKIEAFHRNRRLMDLHNKEIPAPRDPRLTLGAFEPDKFRRLCENLAFKSILSDFDDWIAPFRERANGAA